MEKDDIASIFCLIYCTFQQEMYPEDNDIAPTSQKQCSRRPKKCSQKTKALPYESESITPKGQKQCSTSLKALLLTLQSIAPERAEHCFGASRA